MRTIPIAEDVAERFDVTAHVNLTEGRTRRKGRKYVAVYDNGGLDKIMDLDPEDARTLAEALLTAASVAEAQS